MTMSITVRYYPFVTAESLKPFNDQALPSWSSIVNEITLDLSLEELAGMMIMCDVLATIMLFDNGSINKDAVTHLHFHSRYEYTALLGISEEEGPEVSSVKVSFVSMDFLKGAAQVCMMLGIDPSSKISHVKYHGISAIIDYKMYFGKLEVSSFSDKAGLARYKIDPVFVDTLLKILSECFPDINEVGANVPIGIYHITPDKSNVISCAFATSHLPSPSLTAYTHLNAWYVFNVCTDSRYRGRGLAKSVIIYMVNQLRKQGVKSLLLEVLPDNEAAYSIYRSLGFARLDTIYDDGAQYDILYLNI